MAWTSIGNATGLILIYIVMQAGSLQLGSPLQSQAPAELSGYPETPAPGPAAMSLYSQEHAPAHHQGLGHGSAAGVAGETPQMHSYDGLSTLLHQSHAFDWALHDAGSSNLKQICGMALGRAPELTWGCLICSRRGHSSSSDCCCCAHMLPEAAVCWQISARDPQAKPTMAGLPTTLRPPVYKQVIFFGVSERKAYLYPAAIRCNAY